MNRDRKPLGSKNYGHIAHVPGSRMGPGDHSCHEGQARIATVKTRDKHDLITVLEKLDGSNCGVARIDGIIYPLTRAGYLASTSPYEQHWRFGEWVYEHQDRFLSILNDGERLVGEWLMQAHGTRYTLQHEPFVVFDLMSNGHQRLPYQQLLDRIDGRLETPHVLHIGEACSIERAMTLLSTYGFHGACDPVEGAVWRVERNEIVADSAGQRAWKVDFLVKYVRPDKKDGCYLPEMSQREAIWNWRPQR